MNNAKYQKMRNLQKLAFIRRTSAQAKVAKSRRIQDGKGRNGKSMNSATLEAHGLQREGGEA